MTKFYDEFSRCKNCYRLFTPKDNKDLVCHNCLEPEIDGIEPEMDELEIKFKGLRTEPEIKSNTVTANNFAYWEHLNNFTEMLSNFSFFKN